MAPDNENNDKPSQEESDSHMRQRLVNSLSQSFPGSALSRALKLMDPLDECDGDLDPLNSSCYAEISLEKGPIDDDELTSLSWLQDTDLLKNIHAGEEGGAQDGQKENNDGIKLEPKDGAPQMHPPHVPYNPQKHINSKPPYSFSCLIFMAIEDSPQKRLPVKDIYSWILTHFPYFQNAPTGWKNSVRHNLSLNKCFKKVDKEKGQSIGKGSLWCIDPEYRPNLLQALKKTPYHPYHQLQMLASPQPQYALSGAHRPLPLTTRININTPSPHLFPFLSKRLAQSKLNSELDIDVANTLVSLKGGSGSYRASENPRLKPLTPLNVFQNGTNGRNYRDRSPSPPEFGSEKNHRRRFSPYSTKKRSGSPIVYTSSPSEDHTYSVSSSQEGPLGSPNSTRSSIDEEYEFGHKGNEAFSDVESSDGSYNSDASDYDESDSKMEDQSEILQRKFKMLSLPVKKRYSRVIMQEEEEAAKIMSGADALLNLAGIKTSHIVPMRSISPVNNNNSIVVKREMNVSS